MAKTDLTAAELRARFTYDPHSGLFRRFYKNKKNSKPVGVMIQKGYIIIVIDGVQHKAHRLALLNWKLADRPNRPYRWV